MTDTLYDEDFVVWTERQADALRSLAREGSNLPLDWEHLAEEIEDLGSAVRHKVEHLVAQILVHLLKLACSPSDGPRGKWMGEVDVFRVQLNKVLRDAPSIRSRMAEIATEELPTAFRLVERAFKRHGEADAIAALAGWRARGISADEVMDEGLYPDRTVPAMINDGL